MPAQTVIKLRRDTAADWTSADPTLAAGEAGFESDSNKLKIGDGSTAWTTLSYTSGGASVEVGDTAPVDAEANTLGWDSVNAVLYIKYDGFWVEAVGTLVGPQGAAGKFTTSDTAPGSPGVGDGWFDSNNARFFIYYDSYWVEAATNFKGATGSQGIQGAAGADGTFSSTQTIETKSSAHSLVSGDAGKLILNSAAITVTVEGLAVGQQVDFVQNTADQITFAAGAGITLNSKDGNLKTAAQYSPAGVKCVATNTYVLVGDLGA